MSFRLTPLKKGTAPVIALYRPVLLIGRHLDCDVRIDSPKISRRHCCVALAYDRVLIRDLGSRNGVRVNGRLIEESRLFFGDELAIGPVLFRMDLEPEEAAPGQSGSPASTAGAKRSGPSTAMAPPGVPPHLSQSPEPSSDLDLVPLED
jgi:pSer/pThr/pTyr-binding forkhead associated (FHA) protein